MKYEIAGIKIEINYQYQEYFNNNIEKYQIADDEVVNYKITTKLLDHIELPKGEVLTKMNPYVIKNEDQTIIYALNNNNEVKELIQHKNDFSDVLILINKDIVSNPSDVEYILIGLMFLEIATKNKLIPIHASAIIYNNDGILFSAPSKTGKSTHAKIWVDYLDATLINDDKPLIKIDNNEILIYGSPFSGKGKQNSNQKAILKSIIFLKQGISNKVNLLDKKEIIENLMRNILRPKDEIDLDHLLLDIEVLMDKINFYSIEANMEIDAAINIKNMLYKE
jgi:hypothetical protein